MLSLGRLNLGSAFHYRFFHLSGSSPESDQLNVNVRVLWLMQHRRFWMWGGGISSPFFGEVG